MTMTSTRSGRRSSGSSTHFALQQPQLPSRHLAQTADTNSDQPQRPRHQFFLRQKKTTEPINVPRFGDWFLDRDLPRARGEIAVTDFDLHSLRGEAAAFKFTRNFRSLFAQTFALRWPLVRVAQEGFFAADALDLIAQFERTVVFAERKLLQLRPKRAGQRPQVGRII